MSDSEDKIISYYWKEKVRDKEVYEFDLTVPRIDKRLLVKGEDCASFNNVTSGKDIVIYTVCMAIYNALLQRYFEGPEAIFSSCSAIKDGKPLLINTHSLSDHTLKDSLQTTKAEIQEVYRHANYDDEELKRLNLESFNYYTPYALIFSQDLLKSINPFALAVCKSGENGIYLQLSYSSYFVDKFKAEHFLLMFSRMIRNLDSYLNSLLATASLLTEREFDTVVEHFNQHAPLTGSVPSGTIIQLFEKQATDAPAVTAIVFGEQRFTYKEINHQANQLATCLIHKYQVQPGDFVGVKLDRSQHLIISLLAVLKAGAAYVPIDTAYPQERVAYLEEDSQSKVIIDQPFIDHFLSVRDTYDKHNPTIYRAGDDIAYLIYTSGTTGQPKGVMITHSNAMAFMQWAWEEFDNASFKTVYAATSHCFDLSVFEIFYTLSVGSTIRVLKNALDIPIYMKSDSHILLNTVPSVIRKLITDKGEAILSNVNVLNLAGEPFPADLAARLVANIPQVRNLYGPSEDTTYSTVYRVSGQTYINVPIGRPIRGTRAYILDDNLQPIPPGMPGKLYLAGAGVAAGYLNKPELTAEKFLENPFRKGERMYDTGDLALWMPDGNITFLGRKDNQVKLRGYRIELGEIENAISGFSEAINEVVVEIIEKNTGPALTAFYVSRKDIEHEALRVFVAGKLPAYMLPNAFLKLESIPLTPNGKVDRKALSVMAGKKTGTGEIVAPVNEVERGIHAIWQEVLGTDRFGTTDNFFELGGHSLMIRQVINSMQRQLGISISFNAFYVNPTIRYFSNKADKDVFSAIPILSDQATYPVTPGQRRLYALSQLGDSSKAYHISGALSLEGNLNIEQLEAALRHVIARHEILRTGFRLDADNQLRQYVVPAEKFETSLKVLDFSTTQYPYKTASDFITTARQEAFDLSAAAGLFRVYIIKAEDDKHLLALIMHHIIGDGWSLEVFIKEVFSAYGQLQQTKKISLPELPIQYKDYTAWLDNQNQSDTQKEARSYWLNQFNDEVPVLELPGKNKRPTVRTSAGKEIVFHYSQAFLSQLKGFAKKNQVTLFTVLMSGINALLSRYSNQNDIVLGTPIAGREHPDLENQIGLYLNTLAVRTRIQERETFSSLIEKEKKVLFDAYAYQRYPFDQLVDELSIVRDTSRSPLFDVLVVLHNQQQLNAFDYERAGAVFISPYDIPQDTAQFDISFAFTEKEGLTLRLTYNSDIYSASFIERLPAHLENMLLGGMNVPSREISDINLLSQSEEQQLLDEFNRTTVDYPAEDTLLSLFHAQAGKSPEAVAVLAEERALTYRELDEASNRLARYLITEYGLVSEDLVGVKLERSEWLLISLLAVLKTGAAYVPIDPNYPESRIAFMEADSNRKLTIDQSLLNDFHASSPSSVHPGKTISPGDLAYVLYTSGSTGQPKGVMIEHRNVVALLHWAVKEFSRTGAETVYAVTSHCFDLSVFELFYPLITGKKVRILKDGLSIAGHLSEDRAVLINTVPSVMHSLLQTGLDLQNIVAINLAGEPFPLSIADHLKDSGIEVRNLYGPSEDTTYSTSYRLDGTYDTTVPIGRPVSNTQAYVLSEAMQLQPVGVSGQLYLGGSGLARGYLNREELTGEKFIASPFNPGERLYKTGDLCRWLPGTILEYQGRIDDQVKVRGHRIELGEIEHTLLSHPGVNEAVVVVRTEHSEASLIAYLVVSDDLDKAEVKDYLSSKLPAYMVPAYFIDLEAIPMTANGKVDKKALPAVSSEDVVVRQYETPRSKLEAELVQIWEEVLNVEGVGITDSFFELGGHSLRAVRLVNKVQQSLGLSMEVRDLFQYPTIKVIAPRLVSRDSSNIEAAPKKERYRATPSQHRLWVLSQFEEGNISYNIPGAYQLAGNIDREMIQCAYNALLARYESLRTSFREEKGVLYQYISGTEEINSDIAYYDLRENYATEESVTPLLNKIYRHTFELSQAPLFKVALIRTHSDEYLMVFNIHHIISDGWSMEILVKEFSHLYTGMVRDAQPALPELQIQFRDYSEWLLSEARQAELNESEKYWTQQFSGDLPVLELPSFQARPQVKTYKGSSYTHSFSSSLTRLLHDFGHKQKASLFMLLMSGINGLFSRYTNTEDIIIGTPVAGRDHVELENQVGLFLNTLAIRTRFDKNANFAGLLDIQKKTLLDAYAHQQYSFDKLVAHLDLQRDTSRSALFDVLVVLQNQQGLLGQNEISEGEISMTPYRDYTRTVSQFDISLIFSEKEGCLSLYLEYNTDIYSADFIRQLAMHLEGFLVAGIENPEQPIATINYLGQSEEQQLLDEFNRTTVDYPAEDTLLSLFHAQAGKSPEAVAVLAEERALTYRELDEASNRLARYLITEYGLVSEDLVGVKLERSEWLLISLLAVLKTGAAYVPIDPNYPESRIAFMEADSNRKLTIDQSLLNDFHASSPSSVHPGKTISPGDLAYVLYTSGSTGQPKGVMIEHRNVVALLHWAVKEFSRTGAETVYAVTSHCFDLSVFELFYPLITGKKVRILKDGLSIAGHLSEDRAVLINTVPSVMHSLLQTGLDLQNIVAINLAGEPFPLSIADHLKDSGIEVRNLYGPSEDTTYSTSYRLDGTYDTTVPIGRPVSNTQAYVLSEAMQLQPVGVSGQLYLGGSGLARGYLNREELTGEKFIASPFNPGERLYKTGDLCRWLPGTILEYQGRIDDQVKVRGHRIELGEIEHIISLESAVSKVVVTVHKEEAGHNLAAYIVSTDQLDKTALKTRLAASLPGYMVPAYYVKVDTIPVTANGKVDRKALPEITQDDLLVNEYIAPSTSIETTLAEMWKKVLQVDKVGVMDDFFELGGHSLHITRMLYEINAIFDIKLEIKHVFAARNISTLAQLIENEVAFNEVITGSESKVESAEESQNTEVWEI
ncbi:amino acid adenylation domain-containing protein [Roseivirga sp. BDSF3-8]|uniref:amino acid adenylation domain-containing protein n=1 Tax=Roseivirga sp. BDSF3-8 TaxID=3241598 RepID=UPI00353252BE